MEQTNSRLGIFSTYPLFFDKSPKCVGCYKSLIMIKLPVFALFHPTVGNNDERRDDLTQTFSLATSKNLLLNELIFQLINRF